MGRGAIVEHIHAGGIALEMPASDQRGTRAKHGEGAGRMAVRAYASASSPLTGVVRLPDPEVPA